MAPNASKCNEHGIFSSELTHWKKHEEVEKEELKPRKYRIIWPITILYLSYHIISIYGFYLWFYKIKWSSCLFLYFYGFFTALGVTAGAHRLFAHRSYKARKPLKIFLLFLFTAAFQYNLYDWCRNHRLHHKYSDTDADPHDARRGFFYSHVGWLLVRKTKEVKEKRETIDMSDLDADPYVTFHRKYYYLLMPFCTYVHIILPLYYFFQEDLMTCIFLSIVRHVTELNLTFFTNSLAHYGDSARPYDKNSRACNSFPAAWVCIGEGWHNYHHAFPWDYRIDEIDWDLTNLTTVFIKCCAKMGWAYDLKTASPDFVRQRTKRTGEGTRIFEEDDPCDELENITTPIWGYDDADMTNEVKQFVNVEFAGDEK